MRVRNAIRALAGLGVALGLGAGTATAQETALKDLKVGDMAPSFLSLP